MNRFQLLIDRLSTFEFSNAEINRIHCIIAAILHLGNIEFTLNAKERLEFKSKTTFQSVARLLQVEETVLEKALLNRVLRIERQNEECT